jgi:hypothetical protein
LWTRVDFSALTATHQLLTLLESYSGRKFTESTGENQMGANHAGERKRKKLKITKKIARTQIKKAKIKAS